MARRSLKDPALAVSQTYDTGCTWRLYRIFDYREGHSRKRLVSNRKNLKTHVIGNGNSRSMHDVLSIGDGKYPHIDVNSKRRDYSCRKSDQVANQGNEATKMIVDDKIINGKYFNEDGAGSEPKQLFDASQILYSNKELFLKLLHDPNSLLVKQIHDLHNSQGKEPYQVRQKMLTTSAHESRSNKSQKSNGRQCEKLFESSDRYNSCSSCDHQSSSRAVVLNPSPNKVQSFADTDSHCPSLLSRNSFRHNVRTVKPSSFPFACIKEKLGQAMGGRKKEQQRRTVSGVLHKFSCGCQGLEDVNKVIGLLEGVKKNSHCSVHSGTEIKGKSSLDLQKGDKRIKVKDLETCIGEEGALYGQSCCRNINCTSISPFEPNMLNKPAEAEKNPSEMLNCRNEECKQWTNTEGRKIPLPEFDSLLRSSRRYREHSSLTEGIRYFPLNNYQMVLRTKLGLQKEGKNSCFGSSGQNVGVVVNTPSDQLHQFGTEINIRKSSAGDYLHASYGIPRAGSEDHIKSSYETHMRESRQVNVASEPDNSLEDSPTQRFEINNTTATFESLWVSPPDIQTLTSPELTSPSPSFCQGVYPININSIDNATTESVLLQLIDEDVSNPPNTISQPAESPVPAVDDKQEKDCDAGLIRSSSDAVNNINSSINVSDYVREILQAFSLKWDDIMMNQPSNQLMDPSTVDELKGFTNQLSGGAILFDCVKEVFMEAFQLCRFPPQVSKLNPNVQAYIVKRILVNEVTELINLHLLRNPLPGTLEQLVEKDLASRGSWLNTQIDIENIVIEMEEDVLEELLLEIISEMDVRSMMHCFI